MRFQLAELVSALLAKEAVYVALGLRGHRLLLLGLIIETAPIPHLRVPRGFLGGQHHWVCLPAAA